MFLLLENGEPLLQENGNEIFLESAADSRFSILTATGSYAPELSLDGVVTSHIDKEGSFSSIIEKFGVSDAVGEEDVN